ncbi:MAG: hypothetical protein IPP72_00340 [Chitinophagaceae bacterium]|nr:hypothetical protein [Chitinophagaceae bacterium]
MKRLLNILLLFTFLLGYLEWGKGNHLFIFQAEAEIFQKAATGIQSILHPFILIPFLGQLIIIYTIFQKQPGRLLTLVGLACLSLIMLFLLFIGIVSFNSKIVASTIPFLIVGILVLRCHWKKASTV